MNDDKYVSAYQKALKKQIEQSQLIGNVIYKLAEESSKITKIIADAVKPFVNALIEEINKCTPYFKELGEAIEKSKKDPNSFLNWNNYSKKLSEYFWVFPYKLKTSDLKEILENVNTEQEFDNYMNEYFNSELVDNLIADIKLNIPTKYKTIFNQIARAYKNRSYSLCNTAMMTIIDGMCSYYLINKGNVKRQNLFKGIAYDLSVENYDWSIIFNLLMLNNSINILYDDIDFNSQINIISNKKSRRNVTGHGFSYSNKKMDSIMLLNLIYNMSIIYKSLKGYKSTLMYDAKKKHFVVASKIEKKQILDKIKANQLKKNAEKQQNM